MIVGDETNNPPIVDVHAAAVAQAYWQRACEAQDFERLRFAHESIVFGYKARGLDMPDLVAF